MRTGIALCLALLSSAASADVHQPKPSARPAGTPVLHSRDAANTKDADAEIRAAKIAMQQAKARKASQRAALAASKATKRAERAALKAKLAEAFEACMDGAVGRLDEDEAAEICHAEIK